MAIYKLYMPMYGYSHTTYAYIIYSIYGYLHTTYAYVWLFTNYIWLFIYYICLHMDICMNIVLLYDILNTKHLFLDV